MKTLWWKTRTRESEFSASSTAEQVTQGIDGSTLTAIVTGASSGIGLETTRVLAKRGVNVIMGVRNVKKGEAVKTTILEEIPNAKIQVIELELSSVSSVKDFASQFLSTNLPLNILINNAGVYAPKVMFSEDNIELNFAVNYLGHFLLTNLLLETMKNTAEKSNTEGRIINVSSLAHYYAKSIPFHSLGSSSYMAYSVSKLATVLHAKRLAKLFKDENIDITANSVDPGLVDTNILRHAWYFKVIFWLVNKLLLKNVQQGAATTCYVALHPQNKGVNGQYFANCNITEASSHANDEVLAKKLWDFSLDLCG